MNIFLIIIVGIYFIIGFLVLVVGIGGDIIDGQSFPSDDNQNIIKSILYCIFVIILGWGFVLSWIFISSMAETMVEYRWFKRIIQYIINVDSMIIGEVLR